MKERFIAIFMGLLMLLSVAGYAIINVYKAPVKEESINPIIKRVLTPEEKIGILRSGKIIIENFYTKNCTECIDRNNLLESFVVQFKDYIIMEEVLMNQTSLKIIGKGGKIKNIKNVTEENLMDVFCEMAILQPKECLLREM